MFTQKDWEDAGKELRIVSDEFAAAKLDAGRARELANRIKVILNIIGQIPFRKLSPVGKELVRAGTDTIKLIDTYIELLEAIK